MGWAQENHSGAEVMKLLESAMRRWFWLPAAILLLAGAQLVLWAVDRKPPFAVLHTTPAIGIRGQEVRLQAAVRRDLWRGCSVKFSRYVFDANGFRRDLEVERSVSAEFIAALERKSPGQLLVVIKLSQEFPLGNSSLVTDLHYCCNPLHVLWPIAVKTEIPFVVAP